jgi:hypothetical protein
MDEKMQSKKVFECYKNKYKSHQFSLSVKEKMSILEGAKNIYLYSDKAIDDTEVKGIDKDQRMKVKKILEQWLPDSIQ